MMRSLTSRNGSALFWPSCQIQMRPVCSTTNSARVARRREGHDGLLEAVRDGLQGGLAAAGAAARSGSRPAPERSEPWSAPRPTTRARRSAPARSSAPAARWHRLRRWLAGGRRRLRRGGVVVVVAAAAAGREQRDHQHRGQRGARRAHEGVSPASRERLRERRDEADDERAELAVAGRHLVVSHLVYDVLDRLRVLHEQRDHPLPVAEPGRRRYELQDAAGKRAPERAVAVHQPLAVLERQRRTSCPRRPAAWPWGSSRGPAAGAGRAGAGGCRASRRRAASRRRRGTRWPR